MPFLKHAGGRLYYEVCGHGEPLVLLHGLAADVVSWLPVKDLLSAKRRLVLMDDRLSGRSVSKRPPASIKDLAADVKTLLDHLGIEKANLLGHSMGGYVAQEFAIAFPKRTAALILVSSAAASSRRNNALLAAVTDMLKREGYTETFWRTMFPWLLPASLYETKPDYVEMAIKAACDYPHLPTVDNFERLVGLISRHDVQGRLKRIKARCLVLCGGRDILITPEESRALADAIPGARFICAKDAGHNVHLEFPELFLRTIDSFLPK